MLHSPFGLQCVILTFFVAFISSFNPPFVLNGWYFSESYEQKEAFFLPLSEEGFLKNNIGVDTSGFGEVLVKDDDGNLIRKILPKKRVEKIEYKVKSGDTLTKIAHKFGVRVSTIVWANKANSKHSLSIGNILVIPPTDGIYYKAQEGETLSEIAKIHDIEISKIRAYNKKIRDDKIYKGQEIFLPEAKKIYVAQPKTPTYTSGKKNYGPAPVVPLGSLRLFKPSKGVITQGYKPGHYAVDIANALNTPIYAAEAGKVIKAETSGWNYGYGRVIIVDHGNGIETLYSHNNIIKVDVGEVVRKGQLIALMGNTGRVFGRTGIHLHFELRVNGRKLNPFKYW